jgi:hypothetical protein
MAAEKRRQQRKGNEFSSAFSAPLRLILSAPLRLIPVQLQAPRPTDPLAGIGKARRQKRRQVGVGILGQQRRERCGDG